MCLSELPPFIPESSSLHLNLTHSRVGRDNLSVYFAKMADDLVLENDVEAGKVMTRPVTENSYTDIRHGSVLE